MASNRPRKVDEIDNEGNAEDTVLAAFRAIDEAETNEGLAAEQEQKSAGRPRTPNHNAKPSADKDGHVHYPWNCYHFIGYLHEDPEFSMTESGLEMCKGRVRISQGKDKSTGEWKPSIWLSWVMFGEKAETVYNDFRHKDKVMMKGRLQVREYQDRNDVKRQSWEVIVDYCQLQEEQEGF